MPMTTFAVEIEEVRDWRRAIISRTDRITGRSLPRSKFAKLSLRLAPRPPTREQVKINEVANCCQNFVTQSRKDQQNRFVVVGKRKS